MVRTMKRLIMAALFLFVVTAAWAADVPAGWKLEFPKTNFDKAIVDLDEIVSGGPPKDGIPSIDRPEFRPASNAEWLEDRSPVMSVAVGGEARAYPFAILIRHEIVNDRIGDLPIAVTYCPLCNAAVVFKRVVEGREVTFGTTGRLRNSDLVMYDRWSETWWQQFTGRAIVGEHAGTELERIPARIESFAKFKERHPDGKLLERPFSRHGVYGQNPYVGYDSEARPFLYRGEMPENVPPLGRVVTVGERAWSLELVRDKKRIETPDGLVITWEPGQASAMDEAVIAESRDVGNVVVQRKTPDGLEDVVYGVDFAFAFKAFYPEARIVTELES